MKLLTTPKEMALAMNFGTYPVIIYDLDTRKGGKAVIIHKTQFGDLRTKLELELGMNRADDNKLYLANSGSMMKSDYSVDDHLENAEYANAPTIKENQEVAIFMFSKIRKVAFVRMVKSGRIDPNCVVATELEDIEEE